MFVGGAETGKRDGGGGGSCGGGTSVTASGKLSLALWPLNLRAASSYALAAASAVSNVPNQTLAALWGSLISAAHFPHGLCLTPLYFLISLTSSDDCATTGEALVVEIPVVSETATKGFHH